MGPAAALEIPWYPHQKNNTELSASILHPGTVFIWITPPNPLSNDMTQWVTIPQILLMEKHWVFGREWLECSGKRRVSNEFQRNRIFGMITAHWICISTGSIWDFQSITLTHLLTAKAFLNSTHFSAGGFGKVNWFSPKTLEDHIWSTTYWLERFVLAGPWTHRVGIYLKLTRESVTVQHDPLGAHEPADVVEGGPDEKTRFKQRTECG